ncbi:MAG TPA: hypothetical protein DEB40_01470, partial [Elusimicrobia bacterium]|nr:hypothetical protein [Elusimicrobiota bacterium]
MTTAEYLHRGKEVVDSLRKIIIRVGGDAGASFNRQPIWVRRAAAYGLLAFAVFIGYAQYQRLRETASIENDSKGLQVYDGALGGRNLENRLIETGSTKKEVRGILKALSRHGGQGCAYKGDSYKIVRSGDDAFLHLTVIRGLKRIVVTPKTDGGFAGRADAIEVMTTRRHARGDIRGSLWLSMQSAGVPPPLIQEFADVFQWSVDFLTETHDGDRFAATWTESRSPDGRIWSRTVAGGIYEGKVVGRNVGVLYDDGYYDEKGTSLQRMFLKAPLSYRRISSSFSNSRYHPILRYRRPHHGTDYAAAYGTPVSAVGRGVVTYAGYRGGMGNAIEIRHGSGYSTIYGHLKGFAKGIRKGVHVRQGQVIAYVGSTGIST